MGMAASQARLLSITGRLTNNEYNAQTLANSKIRLAQQGTEAKMEYTNSLDASKLVYNEYAKDGSITSQDLTAGLLLSYADCKNQYALVNNSGNILVNSVDIKNYENSSSLESFLSNYFDRISNPQFIEQYKAVYGDDYRKFINDDVYFLYNDKIAQNSPDKQSLHDILNQAVSFDKSSGLYNHSTIIERDENGDRVKDENGAYNIDVASIQNYLNTTTQLNGKLEDLGLSGLTSDSPYNRLLSTLTEMPEVPSIPGVVLEGVSTTESLPSKPPVPVYPQKPVQADYQMDNPYVDPLYSASFVNTYCNSDPVMYDEATGEISNISLRGAGLSSSNLLGLCYTMLKENTQYQNSDGKYVKTPEDHKQSLGHDSDGNWTWHSDSNFVQMRRAIWSASTDEKVRQKIIDIYFTLNSRVLAYNDDEVVVPKTPAAQKHDLELYNQAVVDYEKAVKDREDYDGILGTGIGWQATIDKLDEAVDKAAKRMNDLKEICENENEYVITKNFMKEPTNSVVVSCIETMLTEQLIKTIKLNGQPDFVDDVAAYETAREEWQAKVDELNEEYQKELKKYNDEVEKFADKFEKSLIAIYESYVTSEKAYKVELDELSKISPDMVNENDAKFQWYKNLYYRMGGGKEQTYTSIDDNLLFNSEWLKFALEHGVLSLEQAKFNINGSEKYPEMGMYDWNSMIYTNAADISSKEDEIAKQAAEAKYNRTLREIQSKDKKIDQDLRQLDTEHNALQTEYESLKEVINKNTERSFKMFS